MPERKKQHYVPQLYMRGFTDDGTLPSYQLNHREEFPPTSIHNLCYENYFYDEEGEAEEAMSRLENRFASVLRNVREGESIRVLESTEDEMFFYMFMTHTHVRTKTGKRESRELSTNVVEVLLEAQEGDMEGEDEEMRQKVLEQIREDELWIEHTSVFPMQEIQSLQGHILIEDLEAVLLKDSTGRGFIFSDHPVEMDNPMYKRNTGNANAGFQSPGLMLFCPISSDLTVMMYDPFCYEIPDDQVIEVGSDIVEELNKFQLVNALNAVFYEEAGRGREMAILHDEIQEYRRESLNKMKWFGGDDPRFDTDNEVVGFGNNLADFSPDLPFVTLQRADSSPTRSPERVELVKEYMDEILEEARERQASVEAANGDG